MRYMTFRASCSYAGLANLLALRGIETTDREIALEMGLPYLFAYEDGAYLAGPMLQGARWFALYLQPRGLRLEERTVPREELKAELARSGPSMLGLRVSPEGKHAVLYTGVHDGRFCFLNNKWERSEEPETLALTEQELLSRTDAAVTVGTLAAVPPAPSEKAVRRRESAAVLTALGTELDAFCAGARDPEELRHARDPLFRALLLDGVTMLELLGEESLCGELRALQGQLMAALKVREDIPAGGILDTDRLRRAVEDYRALIEAG